MGLEDKYLREIKITVRPTTVTKRGRPFSSGVTVKEGGEKIKLEKNQPLKIVPIESRKRAFIKFLFSSPIGERGEIDLFDEKQKKTIRNLYTVVSIVATIPNEIPSVFANLALAASKIRSFE